MGACCLCFRPHTGRRCGCLAAAARRDILLTYRSELGLPRMLLLRLLVDATVPAARGMAATAAGAEGGKRKENVGDAGTMRLAADKGARPLLSLLLS